LRRNAAARNDVARVPNFQSQFIVTQVIPQVFVEFLGRPTVLHYFALQSGYLLI